jgi:large subunit ribosomal protein L25
MQLIGEKREETGKKTKYVRDRRLLPGVVFGKGLESIPISVGFNEFVKVYDKVGETTVLDLVLEKKAHPVLIRDVQLHHITSQPIHVGFHQINVKEKINANIPVEVINEDKNAMVKSGEALILVLLDEISVEALPYDLPEKFEIDATKLIDMHSEITVNDLTYDKEKVKIIDWDPEDVVAKLDYAHMLEEEEEAAPVEEAEAVAGIEATKEKPATEGGTQDEKAGEKSGPKVEKAGEKTAAAKPEK